MGIFKSFGYCKGEAQDSLTQCRVCKTTERVWEGDYRSQEWKVGWQRVIVEEEKESQEEQQEGYDGR